MLFQLTQIKVVHAVGEKNIIKLLHIGMICLGIKYIESVCSCYILICRYRINRYLSIRGRDFLNTK